MDEESNWYDKVHEGLNELDQVMGNWTLAMIFQEDYKEMMKIKVRVEAYLKAWTDEIVKELEK